MAFLTLKVPPIAVFLAAFGLIVGCSQWLNWANIGLPVRLYVVLLCLVFAGYLGLSAIFEFYRVKTTVHPVHPERARVFVNRGVYRLSRNPMYLGLLILLVGVAIGLGI
ncbi:methyltransferase [Vibrio sp. PP-XX7]